MARVANHHFSDPYQYEHAVRAANVTGFSAERGTFEADLLQVDLDRLWIQAGSETLPRSTHITLSTERAPIFFLIGPGEPAVQTSGIDIKPGMIMMLGPGSSHFQRTQSPTQWGAMSLRPADLAAHGSVIAGREIAVPDQSRVVEPSAPALARLAALHAELRHIARERPETLAHPEVTRALENALVHAMVTCISEATQVDAGYSYRQHVAVMKRLEETIVQHAERALYLAEVCKMVGASERTLRRCCQEQLGMPPNRYLLLRRLHLARQRLLTADHRTASVTDIATGLGFWELGRFSGAYHAAFGELPKATLQRSPHDYAAAQISKIWP